MNYQKAQRSLAPLLSPAGKAYAALMALRAGAYARGLKSSRRPKSFCVSVGNIAWGGSGKTPLADWLLTWGADRGLTTALLSRGYGGRSEKRPLPVKAHTDPAESGDEPLMLARRHPDSYILADPKRRRALDWLEANTTADFIVLDDGMQHLAVRRDLNLVLLRAEDLGPEAWGKVIPAGEWREGPSALARASAFLLRQSAAGFAGQEAEVEARLAAYGKPVFSFDLVPVGLLPLNGQSAPGRDLGGRPYALATGVGSPERVADSALTLLGYAPAETFIYPDHHKFTPADLKRLRKTGLPMLLTAKDAVKIRPPAVGDGELEAYVLESRVAFGPWLFCEDDFSDWFARRWQELV